MYLGAAKFGVYQPAHSAMEELAGKDTANPIAAILAAATMLSASFGMHNEMLSIETAVKAVLKKGIGTAFLGLPKKTGCQKVSEEICMHILNQ